ncbi:MAG: hypothetical protein AAFX03_14370 [Pseudomonadota bacterium]
MRKWLIGLGALAVVLVALAFWLSSAANNYKPEPGERRLEIENVL